ncbi:MAG: DUF2202 domain-containing protein [Actinomycetia bacterium]|nr:DUF2202 domain-containing protein [Actinomycetes bacterium]
MSTRRIKNRWKIAAGLGIVAVVAGAALAFAGSDRSEPAEIQTASTAAVTAPAADVSAPAIAVSSDLSDAEVSDILFMREEEKLARDVYLTLGEIWTTPVFTNIARAEETHMAAVLGLIESYGLDDPVDDNPIGVFVETSLQQMYDDLVEQGSTSLTAALDVGALIEEVDIEDLIDSIDETTASDVMAVWQRLLAGSENHLRAFTSQLGALGIEREPAVLDIATYDDILASATSREQGRSGTSARGGGREGRGRNS